MGHLTWLSCERWADLGASSLYWMSNCFLGIIPRDHRCACVRMRGVRADGGRGRVLARNSALSQFVERYLWSSIVPILRLFRWPIFFFFFYRFFTKWCSGQKEKEEKRENDIELLSFEWTHFMSRQHRFRVGDFLFCYTYTVSAGPPCHKLALRRHYSNPFSTFFCASWIRPPRTHPRSYLGFWGELSWVLIARPCYVHPYHAPTPLPRLFFFNFADQYIEPRFDCRLHDLGRY